MARQAALLLSGVLGRRCVVVVVATRAFDCLVGRLGCIFMVACCCAASAISVAWETYCDHVGSSVIVEVVSESLSSSVEASVATVIIIIPVAASRRDVCFIVYGVFSVSP